MTDSRFPSPADVINRALDSRLAGTRVALPGRIESFDAATQLAKVKPLLQETSIGEDDSEIVESIGVLNNVPVQFPGGGGFVITFPVAAGDPCWLVFADRSLDKWKTAGTEVDPVDLRRHDLSDAVALLGVRSKAAALAEFDAAAAEFGKVGGLHVRVTGTAVHLGVNSGESATDAVALASKVDAQLSALKTTLAAWTPVPGDGGAALKAALATLFAPPSSWPASVASAVVKSK